VIILWLLVLVGMGSLQPASAKARQVEPDAIEAIRLLGPNNEPVKVQVVLTRNVENLRFVANLVKIVARIHEMDRIPPNRAFSVQVFASDQRYLKDLETLVGKKVMKQYVEIAPASICGDIWMQDWGEIAMVKVKGEEKAQLLILDSNRSGASYQFYELAGIPPLLAKLWSAYFLKNPSPQPTSGDMGGNIEITPDDILVVGNTISPEFKAFFERHGYRDRMVVVEADWLSVGHCDEYLSIVPNDRVSEGFTLVRGDPALALKLILDADRKELEMVRQPEYREFLLTLFDYLHGPAEEKKDRLVEFLRAYSPGHGTAPGVRPPRLSSNTSPETHAPLDRKGAERFVRQNLALSAMITSNVRKVAEKVNEVNRLGSRRHSIVAFPMLYGKEEHSGFKAFLPGVINQLILRKHLLVADPKIKVFRDAIRATAKEVGLITHFIDDTPYHERMGDVHCGTNVFRHPNSYVVKPKYLPARWDRPEPRQPNSEAPAR
jgi:hypothetical protein